MISIDSISKSYGPNLALDQVSFEVRKGEILGLLGPNGAGKSTLIRILTQIIDSDSGQVLLDGNVMEPRDIEIFGYLPEERGLYKKMKVGEQLIYLARLKGLSKAEAKEKAVSWVKKLELESWWTKKVGDLSKGMQQKIQFIATVLHEPKILILDEPFSGFDPLNAGLVRDLILEMKENGTTIMLSTHRMESVEELCDRIVLINKAQKVLEGDKKEIKQRFKQNQFRVRFKKEGSLNADQANWKLTDENEQEKEYLIQSGDLGSGQELLRSLSGKYPVIAFNEELPSMDDIFKMAVEQNIHE